MMKEFFSYKRFILIYVIPLFTILMASAAAWTESNLSVIANSQNKKWLLLLWGILLAFYLRYFMRNLFAMTEYQDKQSQRLLFLLSFFAIASVVFPYDPTHFPLLSFLHVVFAFLLPCLFLWIFLRFLTFLSKKNKANFRIFWRLSVGITVIAALLLFRLGFVSSLLEVFVTLSICFLLRFLELRLLDYAEKKKL